MRAIRITGWTMVWLGLFLLGYAGYQLYFTDFLNAQAQAEARQELVVELNARRAQLAAPVEVEPPKTQAGVAADPVAEEPITFFPEEAPAEGEPLGAIRIPKIGLDRVIFEGVDLETLKLGPGHMPWTPVPGQPGNAVISGHRTTYGRPFFDLDLLEPGDLIEVETAVGVHTFTVREIIIVKPTDIWVTEPRPGSWLTLTTCNPRYSARERLIVFAELTDGPNFEYIQSLLVESLEGVS